MLVLSRYVDGVIRIGDDIEIMVVSISGDKCRIGIAAPPEVRIVREEIREEIREVNRTHLVCTCRRSPRIGVCPVHEARP